MLNKKSLIIFLMIFIPVVSLFSFDSDYLNRVTFINNTGGDIWYVFLSPGDSSEWGFDILGSERVLEDNSLLSFYVFYPDPENNFDIMAIDEDGNTFVLFDELFSDEDEVNILIDKSDLEEDDPGMDYLTIEFTNETEYEIFYVFVSPSDSNMWGVDMMDDEQTLGSYETLSLLAPYGDEEVSYDVMAVNENGDEYTFTLNVNPDYSDEDGVISISIESSDLEE
jgi:hypothetical protein